MSDLRGLLDEVEQNPMPDRWDEVRRRPPGPLPEDRRSRLPAALLGVALAIVAAVFAFQALQGGGDAAPADQTDPVGGGPIFDPTASGTYIFTDVGLRRLDPDDVRGQADPDQTLAITYEMTWSGEQYPGDHECRFVVLDDAGRELGAVEGDYSSVNRGPYRGNQQIELDGPLDAATTGEIECDPERQDTPIAYEISDAHVLGLFDWTNTTDAGVMVRFDVGWPVELPDYPGTNRCIVSLARPSGDVVASQVFDLGVGPGPVEVRVWAKDFTDPTAMDRPEELSAEVACSPYTGLEPSPTERLTMAKQTTAVLKAA